MNQRPKCIIITGRAGAGKTTLAGKLGELLWMPVVSRDRIKEGYVNTGGLDHNRLPPETDGLVTNLFFELVNQYLAGDVSIIIEAAFQHHIWQPRMPKILELSRPFLIICTIDEDLAAERHLQRGLADPRREFYHDDKRVSHFRETGEIGTPKPYLTPNFDVPTIQLLTENGYSPSLDKIVDQIRAVNSK